jgi:hypothetical protein
MPEETRTYSVRRISFANGRITETGGRMDRTYHPGRAIEEVPFVLESVIPEWRNYDNEQKRLVKRILTFRLPHEVSHSVNDWIKYNVVRSKPEREIDGHVFSYLKTAKRSTSKDIANHLVEDVSLVAASLRTLRKKGLVGKEKENSVRPTWYLIEDQD